MPTPYPGFPVYTPDIFTPVGSDPDDAATAAVPIEQLADRTAYLKGAFEGMEPEFTDAILHGDTSLPDGTLIAALTFLQINVAGPADFSSDGPLTMGSGDTFGLTVASDIDIIAGGDLTLAALLFDVQAGRLSAAAGAVGIGLAGDTITLTGDTFINGPLRVAAVTLTDADHILDGSQAYEYFITNPSVNRSLQIAGIAPAGWRIRFNAQQATGIFFFSLSISGGGAGWIMRNLAGQTVVIELVSTGSAWIVDQWEEGGNTLRNG